MSVVLLRDSMQLCVQCRAGRKIIVGDLCQQFVRNLALGVAFEVVEYNLSWQFTGRGISFMLNVVPQVGLTPLAISPMVDDRGCIQFAWPLSQTVFIPQLMGDIIRELGISIYQLHRAEVEWTVDRVEEVLLFRVVHNPYDMQFG